MDDRIIMASDHEDSHGDIITESALQGMANTVNGERCVRWTVEHKRNIPPLGKIVDAEVVKEYGHNYLTVEQMKYDVYEELSWNRNLIKASCKTDNRPFVEVNFTPPKKLALEVDPSTFKSFDSFDVYSSSIKEFYPDTEIREYGRKSIINDPEIVIQLAEYYFLYKILKPFVEKTVEKSADRISDKLATDAEKFYELIRKASKEMVSKLKPTKKSISYVIKVPGKPEIELFARVKDAEDLIKALKPRKIEKVKDEMTEFSEKIKVEKAQFILEKGKWKFNYLLTDKGDAIGTKKSFKKRDRVLEYLVEKSTNKFKKS